MKSGRSYEEKRFSSFTYAWPRVQLVKDSNPFVMPLLNLRFFSCYSDISAFIFGHWIGKIASIDGREKLCHRKLYDASENHREKYSEESFCAKHLLNFFLMITMCQNLSDGHENSSGGVKFFDGCEMVRGRGTNNSRRQSIAKYLKGGAPGDWLHSDFQFLFSF